VLNRRMGIFFYGPDKTLRDRRGGGRGTGGADESMNAIARELRVLVTG
jgi:hypothetical protein